MTSSGITSLTAGCEGGGGVTSRDAAGGAVRVTSMTVSSVLLAFVLGLQLTAVIADRRMMKQVLENLPIRPLSHHDNFTPHIPMDEAEIGIASGEGKGVRTNFS